MCQFVFYVGVEQAAEPDPQSPPIDFELVSESDVNQALDTMKQQQERVGWKAPSPQQQLREGFVWQKQLVFRSKLTMHTAFERKDNKEPAAVTCISVAKWVEALVVSSSSETSVFKLGDY